MTASADEAALLDDLRSGDPLRRRRAAERAFDAESARLMAVARRLGLGAADAEDALQEAFVALLRLGPELRGACKLSTWLHRVLIRQALRLRSRQRHAAAVPLEEVAARGVSPAEAASARQQHAAVLAAIDRLPEAQRLVLVLTGIEGLAHADAAAILGVPLGTLWSRLHAARTRLRALLGPAAVHEAAPGPRPAPARSP
jgi:RNA polymerase sigma-70 factor (ECF subfamily)